MITKNRKPGHSFLATHIIAIALICLPLFSACRQTQTPTPTAEVLPPTKTRVSIPTPTAAPTEMMQALTICTLEPQVLSPFVPDATGDDLLALILEEPAERFDYQWVARLLTELPGVENGQVSTRTVDINQGTRYVDLDGVIRTPESDTYLKLPQLTVTFTLKSGLLWSDGTPITAEDSMFGYRLAQSADIEGRWADLVARTAQYIRINDYTVRWEGIPGYVSTDYPGFIFPLQPAHRWQGQSLNNILADRTPPSTGPFKITAWEGGREIRLEPNPNYAGSAPKLQSIIIKFPVQTPDRWAELLLDGSCDVILPNPVMNTDWLGWASLAEQNAATLWADVAPTVLRMDFNLAPLDDEPSPIDDVQVRQAISHCINRRELTLALPGEYVFPAEGIIPPGHPGYPNPESNFSYNPARSAALLRAAGWIDEDENGVREAVGVPGFTDGEPLSITIHLASPYFVTAAYLAGDLEACGFGVTLEPMAIEDLYYPSEQTPLFGRKFEVALLGWQAKVPNVCGIWRSDRIPNSENNWFGENFSGFASQAYDAACTQALSAIEIEQQTGALVDAQNLLLESVPSISIAWRPYWFISGPRVEGFKPDSSAYSALWNSEEIYLDTN